MLVPIEDIKVKERIRKDMGDLSAMADSLRRFGQISPIVITKKNQLIAGGRRLEAARSLGWRTINAVVAELPDEVTRLEYELEENIQRRDFTPEEAEEAVFKINRLKNPSLFRRIWNAIKRLFKTIFRIED
jgi:ParB family chromosome partitioning protein